MTRSQDSKLDELIRLSRERDHQLAELTLQLGEVKTQLREVREDFDTMSRTVQPLADALVFARVGRTFLRFCIGIGMFVAPVAWFLSDRWHLVGQLFKRVN